MFVRLRAVIHPRRLIHVHSFSRLLVALMSHPVQVLHCDLMPPAVADAALHGRSDARDLTAETEGELELLVDDLERHEVVLLVEAAVVEEERVAVKRREAKTRQSSLKFTDHLKSFAISISSLRQRHCEAVASLQRRKQQEVAMLEAARA